MIHNLKHALALVALVLVLPGAASRSVAQAGYQFTNVFDTATPGPNGYFHILNAPAIDSGVAAFLGVSSNVSDNSIPGVYTGSGGPLTTIAKEGFIVNFNSDPVISQGRVAFIAYTTQQNIFVGTGVGPLTTVVKTGDPAPVGNFGGFDSFDINGPVVAFRGYWDPNGVGVFAKTGNVLTTIAKRGDAAPAGEFYSMSTASTDGANVGFIGYYNPNQAGVFFGSGGAHTTLAKTGDPGPYGPHIGFFGAQISSEAAMLLDSPIILMKNGVKSVVAEIGDPAPIGDFYHIGVASLGTDDVAFLGWYENTKNGVFVGNEHGYHAVIKHGDPLFGSTVTGLALSPRGFDRDGSGRVGFAYALADGRQGIAIAAIPEPASCVFAIVGMAALVATSARSRRLGQSPT